MDQFSGKKCRHVSSKSSHRRCSVRKGVFRNVAKFKQNACARVSFLIKFLASTCNFIKKETLAQVLSREFCKISKKTFFTERVWSIVQRTSVKTFKLMLNEILLLNVACSVEKIIHNAQRTLKECSIKPVLPISKTKCFSGLIVAKKEMITLEDNSDENCLKIKA